MRKLAKPLSHDFEGIGRTSTHYIDFASDELPAPPPRRGFFGRVWAKLTFELGALSTNERTSKVESNALSSALPSKGK